MPTLVLASNNDGKLRELRPLLLPLGLHLISQQDLHIPPAAEPHPTFLENALSKARWAAQHSGLPALADDSGLCALALKGAPGVRSARYAGAHADDEANNRHLVHNLQHHTDRRAYYHCVLVLCQSPEDPCPVVTEGRWWGEILIAPRGTGGFGYDPLFWLPERQCSSAQLSFEEKNQLSHRGQAIRQLLAKIRS